MSQKKVEHYKKEKANRKKIMKKQKIESTLTKTALIAVCIGLLGWAGYSGYSMWDAKRPAKSTEIHLEAMQDYLQELES